MLVTQSKIRDHLINKYNCTFPEVSKLCNTLGIFVNLMLHEVEGEYFEIALPIIEPGLQNLAGSKDGTIQYITFELDLRKYFCSKLLRRKVDPENVLFSVDLPTGALSITEYEDIFKVEQDKDNVFDIGILFDLEIVRHVNKDNRDEVLLMRYGECLYTNTDSFSIYTDDTYVIKYQYLDNDMILVEGNYINET